MREWLDSLLAVLLAPVCAACGEPLRSPTRGCICETCWTSIERAPEAVCDVCGDALDPYIAADLQVRRFDGPEGPSLRVGSPEGPSLGTRCCARCLAHPPIVDRARAIGPHTGSLRGIVHALKYDGRRSIARGLASLMTTAAPALVAAADAVVPVPLHGHRRRSRGFNQAHDLARHIGPPVAGALRRIRHTPTQTALPPAERRTNVAGAFAATRQALRLRGATVLLIDDVRTTGATLEACGGVLKQAGVARVWALTAARVATPHD
jgi:ComF family protein